MNNLFKITFFVLLVIFGVYVLNTGIKKEEKAECQKWIKESQIYGGYYLTEWQKEQCLRYGLIGR